MDLVAPNPLIMQSGFIQLGIVVVVAIVAGIKRSERKDGLIIWLKLNAPLVSIILSEIWAILAWLIFKVVPTADDYFIAGLWMAGGSGLIGSIVKDATDGSITTASVAGVVEMRKKNAYKGGIG